MSQRVTIDLLYSPIVLVIGVLLSVFVAELAIMSVLHVDEATLSLAAIDAGILSAVIAPILYLAVFRPTRAHLETRRRLEQDAWTTQRRSMLHTIVAMADNIELRDYYKVGHQARVARLAAAIGAELGLPPAQQENLEFAARIHDIGVTAVPAKILNRPAALIDPERELLHSHAQVGYDLLHNAGFDERVALTLLQHHERLDASGYPQGLKGEAILPEARIIAIADVVEAMSARRAHRPAPGLEAALHELQKNRGPLYDPAAVDACVRLFREKAFALAD